MEWIPHAWGHPTVSVGGAEGWEERNKEAKKAGWGLARPGRSAGQGGGGRVAETKREIKTERLIDRQTEKEGDREICSSSWKTFYQSLFGWFDLGSSLRGRWEGLGPQCETKTVYYIKKGGGGSIVISPNCFLLLLVVAYIIQVYVCTYNF